jgi:hypothetical protein
MHTVSALLAALMTVTVASGCTPQPQAQQGSPQKEARRPAAREQGAGSVTLTWPALAPETYAEGSPDPVAGFRIYLGSTPDALQFEAEIPDPRSTGHVVGSLAKGRHYYAVTTYTRSGVESEKSAVVSKEVQ